MVDKKLIKQFNKEFKGLQVDGEKPNWYIVNEMLLALVNWYFEQGSPVEDISRFINNAYLTNDLLGDYEEFVRDNK